VHLDPRQIERIRPGVGRGEDRSDRRPVPFADQAPDRRCRMAIGRCEVGRRLTEFSGKPRTGAINILGRCAGIETGQIVMACAVIAEIDAFRGQFARAVPTHERTGRNMGAGPDLVPADAFRRQIDHRAESVWTQDRPGVLPEVLQPVVEGDRNRAAMALRQMRGHLVHPQHRQVRDDELRDLPRKDFGRYRGRAGSPGDGMVHQDIDCRR